MTLLTEIPAGWAATCDDGNASLERTVSGHDVCLAVPAGDEPWEWWVTPSGQITSSCMGSALTMHGAICDALYALCELLAGGAP